MSASEPPARCSHSSVLALPAARESLPSAPIPMSAEVLCSEMAHDGVVAIDLVGGGLFITHLLTNERLHLEGVAEAELVFDDGGSGAVAVVQADGESHVYELRDIFKHRLLEATDGQLFLQNTQRKKDALALVPFGGVGHGPSMVVWGRLAHASHMGRNACSRLALEGCVGAMVRPSKFMCVSVFVRFHSSMASVPLATHKDSAPVAFDIEKSRHREGFIMVNVGPCNGASEVRCFVFVRPRCHNQRLFVSYMHLYSLMKLRTFSEQASRWVDAGKERWRSTFVEVFGSQQIVESTFITGHTKKKCQLCWSDRCLADPSVSVMGLLYQLARWCTLSASNGGFSQDLSRAAAGALLQALLDFACPVDGSEWRLTVEVCALWRCAWPRPPPEADGFGVVELSVVRGLVDLTPLLEALKTSMRTKVTKSWMTSLVALQLSDTTAVPLCVLVRATISKAPLAAFNAQLVWAASQQIELGMCAQVARSKRSLSVATISFKWVDDSLHLSGTKLDHKLAKYVSCGRGMTTGAKMVGIATDKATIHALPMQVTILTVPSNLALFACPQVVCVRRLGGGAARVEARTPAPLGSGAFPAWCGGGGNFFSP